MGSPIQMPPLTPKEQFHELKKGVYGVAVTVGRSFQTRLDEGANEMGQILQGNPALLALIGPLYFKYRDFPGSEEISELMKKEQQHMMPWLKTEDGTNVQMLTSQIQQLGEQGQQVQAELAKATEFIKTDQAKLNTQVAIAKGKAELQIHLQGMSDQTTIQVERLRAISKGASINDKAMLDQVELEMKQRHATEMAHTHIRSSQQTQAMKSQDAQILEAMKAQEAQSLESTKSQDAQSLEATKVRGEVTRDAIRAKIDIEKDEATREVPDVRIDLDVPVE